MGQPTDYVSVEQLAERLDCSPAEALELVRRAGPVGTVRTADGRFLVPADGLAELRAARDQGQ